MASEVWKYFKIEPGNENYARCTFCSKLISRGGASKNTTNMIKHLKTHKTMPAQSSQCTGSSKVKQSTTGRPSLANTFKNFFSKPTPSTALEPVSIDTETAVGLDHFYIDDEDIGLDSPIEKDTEIGLESDSIASSPLSAVSPSSSSTSVGPLVSPGSYPKVIAKPKKTFSQKTLPGVYDKVRQFKTNDERAKKINCLIAEMICLDLQPISVVENVGFRRLIRHLEPRYVVPSRKTFSDKILYEMYSNLLAKTKEELTGVQFIAVTTDMWTSIANADYMAVTVHFYKKDGPNLILKHKCLEVTPFPEISHSADNLKDFLVKVLKEWEINEQVVAVVRDNGKDIAAAIDRSPFVPISCVAHTLQLVIKDGFLDNPKICNLVRKAKKLVGSFKHSTKNTKLLKQCQIQLKIPNHRLIQDEPTRWNSTFHMLRRLLEQKEALILIAAKNEIQLSVEMTNDDWRTVEYAVEILEIFENSTLQLSKESSCISEVIPIIHTIQSFLEKRAPPGSGLQGLKNDLLSSLKRRYPAVENNAFFACSTLLDPRFRTTPFRSCESVETAKRILLREMESLNLDPEEEMREVSADLATDEASTSTKGNGKKVVGFWSQYKEVFEVPVENETSKQVKLEEELDLFLKEKNIDPKHSEKVGNYWAASTHQRLVSVALKYLCIPPSTVSSERLFSCAGNICDTKRNRLDPERVKMLVFLNKNIQV